MRRKQFRVTTPLKVFEFIQKEYPGLPMGQIVNAMLTAYAEKLGMPPLEDREPLRKIRQHFLQAEIKEKICFKN